VSVEFVGVPTRILRWGMFPVLVGRPMSMKTRACWQIILRACRFSRDGVVLTLTATLLGCAPADEMPRIKTNATLVCRQAIPLTPAFLEDAGGCFHHSMDCDDTLTVTAHVAPDGHVSSRTFDGPADLQFAACLRKPTRELLFDPAMGCDGERVAGTWRGPTLGITCDAGPFENGAK
jgi:hypothetical protein